MAGTCIYGIVKFVATSRRQKHFKRKKKGFVIYFAVRKKHLW
jgi:hypothetical protein